MADIFIDPLLNLQFRYVILDSWHPSVDGTGADRQEPSAGLPDPFQLIRLLGLGNGTLDQCYVKRPFLPVAALGHFAVDYLQVFKDLSDMVLEIDELKLASCAATVFEHSKPKFLHCFTLPLNVAQPVSGI